MDFQNGRKIKRMRSKRNRVELWEDESGRRVIKKTYADPMNLQKEKENLARLIGLRVPKILQEEKDALVLTYLKGECMGDVLQRWEREGRDAEEIFCALIDWLEELEGRCQGRLADVNLRNFLWDGSRIYGVDFEEEITQGENGLEQNFGGILAFYWLHAPEGTAYKKNMIQKACRLADGRMNVQMVRQAARLEEQRIRARRSE